MNGRLEATLKLKEKNKKTLKGLPEYCTGFYYSMENLQERSRFDYLEIVKKFLKYIDKPIEQIDDIDVNKYFEHIKYKKKPDGTIVETSGALKTLTYITLNKFFSYVYEKDLIKKNPMRLVQKPTQKDNVQRKSLSMEQINKVLQLILRTHTNEWRLKRRNYLAFYLLAYTGMRASALCQINISDIDFKKKVLHVIDKRDNKIDYPLSNEAIAVINKWLENRASMSADREVKTDALFINIARERMDTQELHNMVVKYTELAGYRVSPHKLRASFITLFYEASGHDIEATRQAVGHKRIDTTSRYIASSNDSRKTASAFMSANLKTGF